MGDALGSLVGDFLIWPAEWLSERLWRLHRKEPTWWRVISATVLALATVVIYLAWLALMIGALVLVIYLISS
jgi:hypothetical protein